MPGTPHKKIVAAPPPEPPPPAAGDPDPDPDRIDLLEILATEDLAPVPVTLRGVDAQIRRTYSGEEAVRFLALINDKDFPATLELIADGAGPALWEQIGPLAPEHAAKILNRLFELSTLHEGELLAPLPASFARVAGARPTPDSGVTTG